MISTRTTWRTLAATLLAAGTVLPTAQAQTADALLDKLVEKGVITVREANDLREQSDEGFNRALQAKTGLPDWVNQLKFYGDVRGRYEFFRSENDDPGAATPNKDRDRLRYRLRAGATVTMKDQFELGFRFTSSEPSGGFGGDPISGNTTFQDNGSKKFMYIDLAYGKWTPILTGPLTVSGTLGKMENPFVVSDMVFDGDYTPEGIALQSGYALSDKHSLKFNAGGFVLDEINQGSSAGDDPWMFGAQLRHDAKWTPHLSSTMGASFYMLSEEESLDNAAVPNVNVGNTRYGAAIPGRGVIVGDLVNDYNPFVIDAALTYTFEKAPLYSGNFPVRLAGEYMYNPGAEDENQGWWVGAFFGKAGKKGTWEASYRYKVLERDAWYEEFVDSDFGAYYATTPASFGAGGGYRAGTGLQGHIVKAAYSVSDSFTVGATWFWTEIIDTEDYAAAGFESGQHRVQLDATWKF